MCVTSDISAGVQNRTGMLKLLAMRGLSWLALAVLLLFSVSDTRGLPIPLSFEDRHAGGENKDTEFMTRGYNHQFLLTPRKVILSLARKEIAPEPPGAFGRLDVLRSTSVTTRVLTMEFLGADAKAAMQGLELMPGKINYLLGRDASSWRVGVAAWGKVRTAGLYSGIDLVYYGNEDNLEYDFRVAAGVDPGQIKMKFIGAGKIAVSENGDLEVGLDRQTVRQAKPVCFQEVTGARVNVSGHYEVSGDGVVTIALGEYDHTLPLVIDPTLAYSTYFGGNGGDVASCVRVDPATGDVFLGGITLSRTFPFSTPAGSFQGSYKGGLVDGDAFVARFTNTVTGLALVYFTYLGGAADDGIYDLAVAADGTGQAFVTGFTDSADFPVRPAGGPGGLSGTIGGIKDPGTKQYPTDGFVAQLNASGSDLVYSGYLGGSSQDTGVGISVDAAGNAYVAGFTLSTNFPVVNAFQSTRAASNYNAFISRIGPLGTAMLYSSYLGGTNLTKAEGIANNGPGNVFVTGYTEAKDFRTTVSNTNGILHSMLNEGLNTNLLFDAFVCRFDTTLAGIASETYSALIGGTNDDAGNRIFSDANNNVYITGYSESGNFPNTTTNVPGLRFGVGTNAFNSDAFLLKLDFSGGQPAVVYSALYGGTFNDMGWDVTADSSGNAFVVGVTVSTNFPATTNAGSALGAGNLGLSRTNLGGRDVTVTEFSADGTALIYSGLLGGLRDDYGFGIALDAAGHAIITGRTLSTNFPSVLPFESPIQRTNNAFLARLDLDEVPLRMTLSANTAFFKWSAAPLWATQCHLESSVLGAPASAWAASGGSPVVSNGFCFITLPITNSVPHAYRLKR
jgi:hypothetical protein